MENESKNDIMELAWLAVWITIFAAFTTTFTGFALHAFEINEYMQKYIVYGILGAFGLILTIALFIISWRSNGEKADVIIHSPEKGIGVGKLNIFKSPIKLYFLSVLFFSSICLFLATKNTFFSGFPQTLMQVVPASKLIFAVEPAATVETIFILALSGLCVSLFKKITKEKVLTPIMIGTISFTILWTAYHLLVYGAMEVALFNVLLFGFFCGLISWIMRSWIPAVVFHQVNNFFFFLSIEYSKDLMIVYSIIGLVIWAIITLFILTRKKKIK